MNSIQEVKESLKIRVYILENVDIDIDCPPEFPSQREDRYQPDYHAGAIETACMNTFYPQKVNTNIAKGLKPQNTLNR